jgi:hypothetical protein
MPGHGGYAAVVIAEASAALVYAPYAPAWLYDARVRPVAIAGGRDGRDRDSVLWATKRRRARPPVLHRQAPQRRRQKARILSSELAGRDLDRKPASYRSDVVAFASLRTQANNVRP